MNDLRLFVSHTHADELLVLQVMRFIEAAFVVPVNVVRCTSVPGYALDLGRLPAAELKAELEKTAIVVAIITPASLRSPWVLMELGAAWANSKLTLPLLAGNVDRLLSTMPTPLRDPLCGRLREPSTLFKLADQVAATFGWMRRPGEQAYQAMQSVVAQAVDMEAAPEVSDDRRLLRTDREYAHFHEYSRDAKEILIAALSHGYLIAAGLDAIKTHLRRGCNIKLIIVDPYLPDDSLQIIADHDERVKTNPNFREYLRQEIKSVISTLSGIESFLPSGNRGSLEIRAAKGIPVLTITMVDVNSSISGRMLIEPRPYHQNDGPRPWFELRRSRPEDVRWYQAFYESYYEKLWSDSHILVKF